MDLTRLDYQDMGEVLATYRSWPGPAFWTIIGLFVLLPVVLFVTAPDGTEAVVRGSIGIAALLMFGGPMIGINYFERHRVCEHGLVLGFRKRSKYVIPYATLDPGRVRVVGHLGWLGRLPDVEKGSPRFRVGFGCFEGIALNGLDSAINSPWVDADRPGAAVTPYAWWMLGTRRATRLLADLEAAMLADGYPVSGLAGRARLEEVTARWRPHGPSPIPPRMATDPVIGVHGPPLP